MKRRTLLVGATVLAVGAAFVLARARGADDHPPTARPTGATSAAEARWIVAGGGPTPESNEVSIEDDLRLAAQVFDGPGITLFASGADSNAVRVDDVNLEPDELVRELGAIFNPRPGRTSTYRRARIDADGPAIPSRLLDEIERASSAPGAPLTVYVAGHGDVGETASQNAVVTWANLVITPIDLAAAVKHASRRTRFVITTCYSGGFAELAFAESNPKSGAAPGDVCGLFASTWDREAGGCDPDPDRGRHDGYGVHLLSALDGERRDGTPLSADVLDIDDDGVVSLLDAHTFARLSSKSIDVPTTTSERWLRAVADSSAHSELVPLAHEDAVIGVLGKLYDHPSERQAQAMLELRDAQIAKLVSAESNAATVESEAFWDASAALLARWPVLDDPWHPAWRTTVEDHRTAITAFLASSPTVAKLQAATEATNRIASRRAALEVKRAPLHRLVRAHETKRLASGLAARGGPSWQRYKALLACENSAP